MTGHMMGEFMPVNWPFACPVSVVFSTTTCTQLGLKIGLELGKV